MTVLIFRLSFSAAWVADTGQKHAQAVAEEAWCIVGANHTGAPAAATDGGEEGIRLRLCRKVCQGALTSCSIDSLTTNPVAQEPLLVLDVDTYRGGTAALPRLPACVAGCARALQWHSSATVMAS
jgi:hypothetical protein